MGLSVVGESGASREPSPGSFDQDDSGGLTAQEARLQK